MPKHPGVMSGDAAKETNDEQNILLLLLKDQITGEVVLTYRFRAAISKNTKKSFREDPRGGGFMLTVWHRLGDYGSNPSSTTAASTMSSLCILPSALAQLDLDLFSLPLNLRAF